MNTNGHSYLESILGVLYDRTGNGDINGRFDLVYDLRRHHDLFYNPKGHRVIRVILT